MGNWADRVVRNVCLTAYTCFDPPLGGVSLKTFEGKSSGMSGVANIYIHCSGRWGAIVEVGGGIGTHLLPFGWCFPGGCVVLAEFFDLAGHFHSKALDKNAL